MKPLKVKEIEKVALEVIYLIKKKTHSRMEGRWVMAMVDDFLTWYNLKGNEITKIRKKGNETKRSFRERYN